MFFLRYLRCELSSRKRQAVLIALGLALGVGLVATVTAASSGVQAAESKAMQGLYGVGTDLTVTEPPPKLTPGSGGSGATTFHGGETCVGGKCSTGAQTIDTLTGSAYAPLSYSEVASIAKLPDVAAAGGGLALTDRQTQVPANVGTGGAMPTSNSFGVDGVDFAHSVLGPFTDATVTSGRTFRASDTDSDVAIVDSDYAKANSLKLGGTITIAKVKFTIIGIVSQPQGSNPPDAYIPLARAQALATTNGKSLSGDVNTIYVTAAKSSDIATVQSQIQKMLPSATVTSPSSLANEVTGSMKSTAQLANDLGRWLAILVLIAAFAVACLLTMAAVGRRVREFGTLKALGWRGGRIIAQVMGESIVMGVLGAAMGVGLGFAGAAIINAIAPQMSATVATPTGQQMMMMGANGPETTTPTATHTVPVTMAAAVSANTIVLAVVLAIVGALLAGAVGSWRIGQLRPADALSRVA